MELPERGREAQHVARPARGTDRPDPGVGEIARDERAGQPVGADRIGRDSRGRGAAHELDFGIDGERAAEEGPPEPDDIFFASCLDPERASGEAAGDHAAIVERHVTAKHLREHLHDERSERARVTHGEPPRARARTCASPQAIDGNRSR